MLGLLIHPVVLILIMYVVARHEADLDFIRVFLICLAVSLITWISSFFIGPFSILLYACILPWALVQFCYLRWKIAFLVFGIFFVWQIIYEVLWKVVSKSRF